MGLTRRLGFQAAHDPPLLLATLTGGGGGGGGLEEALESLDRSLVGGKR